MAYDTFNPMKIDRTENRRSREIVTSTEWNEIFNLLITQGDHNSTYLKELQTYLFGDDDNGVLPSALTDIEYLKSDIATKLGIDMAADTYETIADAAAHIIGVDFDESTGIFTFYRNNSTSFQINTLLEKIAVNFAFDEATEKIIITNKDGTTQEIDVSAFLKPNEFSSSNDIVFSVSGNRVTAALDPSVLNAIQTYTNTTKVYRDEAEGFKNAAAASASAAATSASNASTSEANAATSEANAKTSETNAKDSEDMAAYYMREASKFSPTDYQALVADVAALNIDNTQNKADIADLQDDVEDLQDQIPYHTEVTGYASTDTPVVDADLLGQQPPSYYAKQSDMTSVQSSLASNEFTLGTTWTANTTLGDYETYPFMQTIATTEYTDASCPDWYIRSTSGTFMTSEETENKALICGEALFTSTGITFLASEETTVNLKIEVKGN